jgi:hypothetical protein
MEQLQLQQKHKANTRRMAASKSKPSIILDVVKAKIRSLEACSAITEYGQYLCPT